MPAHDPAADAQSKARRVPHVQLVRRLPQRGGRVAQEPQAMRKVRAYALLQVRLSMS